MYNSKTADFSWTSIDFMNNTQIQQKIHREKKLPTMLKNVLKRIFEKFCTVYKILELQKSFDQTKTLFLNIIQEIASRYDRSQSN